MSEINYIDVGHVMTETYSVTYPRSQKAIKPDVQCLNTRSEPSIKSFPTAVSLY